MEYKTSAGDNRLLAVLPVKSIAELRLEQISLPAGEIVLPVDEPVRQVYFPTTAIIAVVGNISNGRMVEVGICGSEGLAGIAALFGENISALERRIQVPGELFRASLSAVQREFDVGGAFQKSILHFTQRFTRQVAMTVVCSRFHTVEQRLVRWLLMRHDRLAGDVIPLTHEFIAQMLGVNRSTVTLAANHLQESGYIKYTWGRITICDRDAMETIVCECYPKKSKA
jgi:CRP-like cAMP-binding protein